mmetsp:Transcript_59337/g.176501  ORF Transcript_59337/g.176501 Transcript_59337/m.176501 type:complete len:131 (+) Transcript_59337:897-1289(+)
MMLVSSAGKRLVKRVADISSAVAAPGVDVACVYSLGVDTPDHYWYSEAGFDKQPKITNGDGDGTVNALSLRLCDRWAHSGVQSRSVKVVKFSGVTHSGMLTDSAVLKALLAELGLAEEVSVAREPPPLVV